MKCTVLRLPGLRGIERVPGVVLALLLVCSCAIGSAARAEYGDIVINNYSDDAGMRPVVFPHWFHRIRYSCKVCHGDLGFEFKAGANSIDMLSIIDGQHCGACHDGDIAWSVENCDLCHSGLPGTPTQVHGSTFQQLVAPTGSGSESRQAP